MAARRAAGGRTGGAQQSLPAAGPPGPEAQYALTGTWEGPDFLPGCYLRPVSESAGLIMIRPPGSSGPAEPPTAAAAASTGAVVAPAAGGAATGEAAASAAQSRSGGGSGSDAEWEFSGLWATGRPHGRDTFLCTIGVGNGEWVDLYAHGPGAGGLGRARPAGHDRVIGRGRLRDEAGGVSVVVSRLAFFPVLGMSQTRSQHPPLASALP